jgi:hypothetical protein
MQRFVLFALLMAVVAGCTDATRPLAPTALEPSLHRDDDDDDDDDGGRTKCIAALPPGTYRSVVVPPGTVCLMSGSVVKGSVYVLEGATFASDHNKIRRSIIAATDAGVFTSEDSIGADVTGAKGSIIVSTFSSIRGDVRARRAFDVRVLGGEVGGDVEIVGGGRIDPARPTLGFAVLCEVIVHKGDVLVTEWGGVGIEVGVSLEAGCGGNMLRKGSMSIERNSVGPGGLSVRDNKVARDIDVVRNRGAGPKGVQFNTAGGSIVCLKNDQPFVGTPNTARRTRGQCAGPRRPGDDPDDDPDDED